MAGVVDETRAQRAEIEDWRLEDVDLPSGTYLSLALTEEDEEEGLRRASSAPMCSGSSAP